MIKCDSCDGFIPVQAKSCPNCRREKFSRRLKSSASMIGVGVVSLTLMACYGAPGDYKQPIRNPEESCDGEHGKHTDHEHPHTPEESE